MPLLGSGPEPRALCGDRAPELVVLLGPIAEDRAPALDHPAVAPVEDVDDVDVEDLGLVLGPGPDVVGDVGRVIRTDHDRYRLHPETATGEFADLLHEAEELVP